MDWTHYAAVNLVYFTLVQSGLTLGVGPCGGLEDAFSCFHLTFVDLVVCLLAAAGSNRRKLFSNHTYACSEFICARFCIELASLHFLPPFCEREGELS